MDAVISGQARTALLFDGDAPVSFHLDAPEAFISRRESDFRFLFGEATDLHFIEDTDQNEVLMWLRTDSEKSSALDLALMLLDRDISETKPLICEALEELLTDESLIAYLDNIFYAKPLPPSADTEKALLACDLHSSKTYQWLAALVEIQSEIAAVSNIWNEIPTDVFGGEPEREDFQKIFVQEGFFRQLVSGYNDKAKINLIYISAGNSKAIKSLPNHRTVLQNIFQPFRQPLVTPEQKKLQKDEWENFVEVKQKGRFNVDREDVKNKVQSQIDYISDAMKRRDMATAKNTTNELISYQSERGEPIHLVKSLCQIAQNAKQYGFYEFQLELTERAVQLGYEDAWTQIQHADALLQNGKFDNALETYNIAISFAQGRNIEDKIVARNGYADVLKSQGKLNEALKIYEQTIKLHPENEVARSGYADILKSQGKLNEALAVYKDIMNQHPENEVARSGYAEVLKSQGKLNEALKIYEETMKLRPEDDVVRNGYAQVLKSQGKLKEALKIYEETMKLHPEDVFVRNGYADVLKSQGKLNEALAVYEETMKLYVENAVARNGYAEVLKSQGKLNEALAVYEETMKLHPEDVFVRCGYADVLKSQGKLNEALGVYEETMKLNPGDVVTRNGLCGVLLLLNRFEEALKKLSYDDLVSSNNWIGLHIRGMIMLKRGDLDEAVKIFEKGAKNDPLPSSNEYFRSALAVARLRRREFREAGELLNEMSTPVLQPVINLLQVHAFGEMKMYPQAEIALQNYRNSPHGKIFAGYSKNREVELVSELNSRYVTSRIHTQSDEWVFQREEDLLLALAP